MRGVGRLGKKLDGNDDIDKLTRPFVDEKTAGMEGEDYDRLYNSEFWIVNELFVHGALNTTDTLNDRSPLALACSSKPDLAVFWTCNNDGFQAALGGLSIQARLTPLLDFDDDVHKSELEGLQLTRTKIEDKSIPYLFGDVARNDAVDRISPIAYRPALEKTLTTFESKNPNADVVLCEVPNVSMIPILFDVGKSVRESLQIRRNLIIDRLRITGRADLITRLPAEGFPYKIDCFGHDVTESILNARITRNILYLAEDSPGSDYEEDLGTLFKEGSKVNMAVLYSRIGRRMKKYIDRKIGVKFPILAMTEGMLNYGTTYVTPGVRDKIRYALGNGSDAHPNWLEFLNEVFGSSFSFREDEILEPNELQSIDTMISRYNQEIADLVRLGPTRRILFQTNALFQSIMSHGHYSFPEADIVIFPTINGGLFSFDGVHPGMIGHAMIAEEMRKTLFDIASVRTNRTVGVVPLSRLVSIPSGILRDIYGMDPPNQYIRINAKR